MLLKHNILQIGLGSMGKRRIRNLLFNGIKKEKIFGFDIRKDRCQEVEKKYSIKTFYNFKGALEQSNPDVFIISTPPDKHTEYFLYAARNKKHFFTEHPTTDKGYKELLKLADGSFVAAPSCTFRFHPAIKTIKKVLDRGAIGKILSFQYHMGQYLPDWHPWEDYRGVYFSKKTTGACREMFTFELGWLSYILNRNVSMLTGFTDKLSDLDMSADDVYSAVLKFENNIIGNITIDIISRKPFRTLRMLGSTGVLEWEWLDDEIKLYETKSKKWKTKKLTRGRNEHSYIATEDMYEEEIEKFLKAIGGKSAYPFTFKENHDLLKALFALEKSNKTNRALTL